VPEIPSREVSVFRSGFFSLLLLFTFSKGLARATESGILISDTNVCRRRRTLRPRRATAPCSASRGWKCGRGGGGGGGGHKRERTLHRSSSLRRAPGPTTLRRRRVWWGTIFALERRVCRA